MANSRDQATTELNAHEQTIDELHHKLAAMPGVDRERLQKAVDTFKGAHRQFSDDALGCMN